MIINVSKSVYFKFRSKFKNLFKVFYISKFNLNVYLAVFFYFTILIFKNQSYLKPKLV